MINSLLLNYFFDLYGSLSKVFFRLDDDGGVSISNLNGVQLPESAPDAPIQDFSWC